MRLPVLVGLVIFSVALIPTVSADPLRIVTCHDVNDVTCSLLSSVCATNQYHDTMAGPYEVSLSNGNANVKVYPATGDSWYVVGICSYVDPLVAAQCIEQAILHQVSPEPCLG